jgi:large subunit ribosomal protein L9
MKVFLVKDVEKIGMAGEIVKVSDGYAANFLFPRKLAVEVTPENEKGFANRLKVVEKRQEVIATKTSMLAERIKGLKITIKSKAHDLDPATSTARLYGAISAHEIVDALAAQGVAVSKSQIAFEKAIKTTGSHSVTLKLSNKLQPQFTVKVVAE